MRGGGCRYFIWHLPELVAPLRANAPPHAVPTAPLPSHAVSPPHTQTGRAPVLHHDGRDAGHTQRGRVARRPQGLVWIQNHHTSKCMLRDTDSLSHHLEVIRQPMIAIFSLCSIYFLRADRSTTSTSMSWRPSSRSLACPPGRASRRSPRRPGGTSSATYLQGVGCRQGHG